MASVLPKQKLHVKNTFLEVVDPEDFQANSLSRSKSDGELSSSNNSNRPRALDPVLIRGRELNCRPHRNVARQTSEDPSSSSTFEDPPSTPSEPVALGPYDDDIGDPMNMQPREEVVPSSPTKKGYGMPTAGSVHHDIGKCKPCLWLHSAQGCSRQADCRFCHLSHSKQTRTRPSKGKRDSVRRRTAQALAEQAAAQEGSQSKRLIKL
eukprot:gnl/TRDRNA2_/TRDRNA2_173330_c0_seq4.p1 gnl/TRDRNA2_/TRDRNA2_173330_c0~~gnl/TRDRNA2_/TRDRNA2_173330_c0_seq4.p1  ORF type:complete len:208 (+),score=25.37 gnl/TRDRNA2_/TRDRNA2_173330_c0_seq4:67-690(+)